ncbi:MAG: alpha/beta hydrolase [Trueperaceae bacterium]|nr:alpha/beta hydrolase [Trueperaceae bacterium]
MTDPTSADGSSFDGRRSFVFRSLPTGVTLHYAVQGDPHGPALVFVHGYADSWYVFAPLLDRLPDNYRIYALSLRGHGESDKPAESDTESYSVEAYASDVKAFVETVVRPTDAPTVTLVGHSLGSFVARKAVLVGTKVDRLVLIGSAPHSVGNPGALALREAVDDLQDPVSVAFVKSLQSTSPLLDPDVMDTVARESAKVPVHVWRAELDAILRDDHSAELARLDVPTLLIWGEEDMLFGRETQEELVRLLPRAELRSFPGLGHAPWLEHPPTIARAITDFLCSPQNVPAPQRRTR